MTCPFCGTFLSKPLVDGISSCSHCQRVFESSKFNELLAAVWFLKKHHMGQQQLEDTLKLSSKEVDLIFNLVIDQELSYDEIVKELKHVGLSM